MGDFGNASRRTRVQDMQPRVYARTHVTRRVQIEGLARGYLSVTRWQAYVPRCCCCCCFPMGRRDIGARDARKRGGREREGHNFQIYVQMFRAGCAPVSPPGEDAYRKVSRRIEKCSRGFRARAMMEHGVDQPRRESRRPFTVRETTTGEKIVVTDHRACFSTKELRGDFYPGMRLK